MAVTCNACIGDGRILMLLMGIMPKRAVTMGIASIITSEIYQITINDTCTISFFSGRKFTELQNFFIIGVILYMTASVV
jgi:hypothetical protein